MTILRGELHLIPGEGLLEPLHPFTSCCPKFLYRNSQGRQKLRKPFKESTHLSSLKLKKTSASALENNLNSANVFKVVESVQTLAANQFFYLQQSFLKRKRAELDIFKRITGCCTFSDTPPGNTHCTHYNVITLDCNALKNVLPILKHCVSTGKKM